MDQCREIEQGRDPVEILERARTCGISLHIPSVHLARMRAASRRVDGGADKLREACMELVASKNFHLQRDIDVTDLQRELEGEFGLLVVAIARAELIGDNAAKAISLLWDLAESIDSSLRRSIARSIASQALAGCTLSDVRIDLCGKINTLSLKGCTLRSVSVHATQIDWISLEGATCELRFGSTKILADHKLNKIDLRSISGCVLVSGVSVVGRVYVEPRDEAMVVLDGINSIGEVIVRPDESSHPVCIVISRSKISKLTITGMKNCSVVIVDSTYSGIRFTNSKVWLHIDEASRTAPGTKKGTAFHSNKREDVKELPISDIKEKWSACFEDYQRFVNASRLTPEEDALLNDDDT